ncbi:TPA: DUF1642 domain-containing protein [Streptococcus suis]
MVAIKSEIAKKINKLFFVQNAKKNTLCRKRKQMNKQEAIEKVKEHGEFYSNMFGGTVKMVPVGPILDIISQIHEPQKVVVPEFVAEWYKFIVESGGNPITSFTDLILTMGKYNGVNQIYNYDTGMYKWIKETPQAIQIIVNMYQFGYEVEKEKLYEITVPGTSNYKNQKQHLVKQGKHWFFCGNDVNRFKYRFTKGQLEAAGFGWVFDCNGVKVVEVERWKNKELDS